MEKLRACFIPLLLPVLALLLTSGPAMARCLSCWELVRVDLAVKTRGTSTVYIKWNSLWFAEGGGERASGPGVGPSALIESEAPIEAYLDVITVDLRNVRMDEVSSGYRKVLKVIDPQARMVYNPKGLSGMALNPGEHDGYESAGPIEELSRQELNLVRSAPPLQATVFEGLELAVCKVYVVNYDGNYDLLKAREAISELAAAYHDAVMAGDHVTASRLGARREFLLEDMLARDVVQIQECY